MIGHKGVWTSGVAHHIGLLLLYSPIKVSFFSPFSFFSQELQFASIELTSKISSLEGLTIKHHSHWRSSQLGVESALSASHSSWDICEKTQLLEAISKPGMGNKAQCCCFFYYLIVGKCAAFHCTFSPRIWLPLHPTPPLIIRVKNKCWDWRNSLLRKLFIFWYQLNALLIKVLDQDKMTLGHLLPLSPTYPMKLMGWKNWDEKMCETSVKYSLGHCFAKCQVGIRYPGIWFFGNQREWALQGINVLCVEDGWMDR